MLPWSLRIGWAVVGDSKALRFEALWDDAHVVGTLLVDSDEIVIIPVPGKALVMPLAVFEQLTTRAIIAAHSMPGADRG